MAEQPGQERTERPTPKKLQHAREDGQVAKSPEISAAAALLASGAGLAWFGGKAMATGANHVFEQSMNALRGGPMGSGDATVLLRDIARTTGLAVMPFFLVVLGTSLLINAGQAQGVLSLKPITPDFSRINPGAGLKKLLSGQAVITLLKSIAKLIVLGFLAWIALRDAWPSISGLNDAEPAVVVAAILRISVRLVLLCGLGFLGVALVDYAIVVFRHQSQLRMTRQEVIQEFRESEGDPIRKVRMRSLAQALVRRRMLHRVKEADVIIVNPTSIAVAIMYDGVATAPIVVAMGRRKIAERILVLARTANIPVVRNIPVARALIGSAKVGMPIPPALYAAVAEVLAFVYKQRGRMPRALAEIRLA
jgi:flagellar biosynthetic protein FlhB